MTRLFNSHVPGLLISSPETLYRFGSSLLLSVVVTVALGIFLALRFYTVNRKPDS
jgi:hypothetical protein